MKLFDVFLIFASLFSVAAICPAQVSLVAHWKFDEASGATASDFIGSFDGTLTGSASFVGGEISGNAVSLTSSVDSIVNMGSSVPGFTTGDFSIVSWIKTKATGGDAIYAGKHLSTVSSGYFLGVNTIGGTGGGANKAVFYPSGSGSNIPFLTTTVNDGEWHQVVGVYTAGGNAQIYVDGGLAEDTETSPAMVGNSVAFLIGGITVGSTPTNLYEGLVDDVQLYSSALNQSNVAYLFVNPGQTVPEPRSAVLSLLGLAVFARRRRYTGAHWVL